MDRVRLPGTDVQISAVCLGVAEIGVRQTEIEAHRLLDSWVQRGGNGIDTARVYSDWIPGEKHRSERIVGDWLKAAGVREQIVLATKAGHPLFENSSRVRLSPSELQQDLEGSLETLGTDYIDVWFLHRDDESIPVEEIIDSCDTFVRDGRVKALGAANWTARRIRKANDYASRAGKAGFVATQLFWNLGSRHYRGLESTLRSMDDNAEQLHESANLVAMPYSSQAGGFFSNWLEGDDVARLKAEQSGYATKANFQIARLAGEIAQRNGIPVGAVVLAFLRSHSFKVVPIIGSGTPAHLAASIEALDFVLSDADSKSLRELTSRKKPMAQQVFVETALNSTSNAQKEAFRLKFAAGLLNPFSGMDVSVRLGQLALNILSRWSIKPLAPKPESGLCYLTIGSRTHWLLLRESMFSVYRSWKKLPTITVVSDGGWSAADFYPAFSWWPGNINVLSREQIIAEAQAAGERDLAEYAEASGWGLKLASIVVLARREPVLFVDADILWFADPADLLGPSDCWARPRGVRESNCYQHRDLALRFCPKVLEPPFVNGGILAMHGEFLPEDILRAMVHEALADPKDGTFEQTIIASAVHRGAGLLPDKINLVAFDDVHRFCQRNMKREGYYSRHYVNWMRHLFYRDALRLRWRSVLSRNYFPSG